MRIVSDIKALALILLASPLLFAGSSGAKAADIPPPASPATSAPDPAGPAAAKNPAAGLSAAENSIPDSVKDVLKRLDKPAEDVTLDDLNSARQAVAKVEILIELEKHLAELDKIRHEREKDTLAPMIPASALQAPSVASSPMQMPIPMVLPREEVTQIAGGSGRYSATIKTGGEEGKTFHVGDHLPDGSFVMDIKPTEVVLQEHNGSTRTLHVKNVDTVFGNS